MSVLCFFLGFTVFSSGDSGECALFFPGVQCGFVFSWGSVCSAGEIVVSVLCFFLGFSVFSSGDSGECALFFPGVQCVQQWR